MKIASFLQACKLLKYNPKTCLPDVSKMSLHLRAHHVAQAKLEIIAEASRGGVELDYDNMDQRKWYGWFLLNNPGFRFVGTYYGISPRSRLAAPGFVISPTKTQNTIAKNTSHFIRRP